MTPAVSHADQPSITAEPAASCPDIEVVFARGTGEPPGATALAVSGKSVAVYGVEYPVSFDFLHAIDGVNDAAAFIKNMGESCPQIKMVSGGYSPRVPPSWNILTATGRPILKFRKPSLTTSRQSRSSVTRRTVSATR